MNIKSLETKIFTPIQYAMLQILLPYLRQQNMFTLLEYQDKFFVLQTSIRLINARVDVSQSTCAPHSLRLKAIPIHSEQYSLFLNSSLSMERAIIAPISIVNRTGQKMCQRVAVIIVYRISRKRT